MEGNQEVITVRVYPKNADCSSVKLTSPDGSFSIFKKGDPEAYEGDDSSYVRFIVKANPTTKYKIAKLIATANGNLSDECEIVINSKTKDPKYEAYYTPYNIDAIIAEMRAYGESQGMIWTEGFYVRNGGLDYGNADDPYDGCSFFFPTRTTDSYDGKSLHDLLFWKFEELEYAAKNSWGYDSLEGCRFKVVVLYNGYVEYCQQEEYEIYLLYG